MPNIFVNDKNLGPIVLVNTLPPLDGSIPFEEINKSCVYKVYEDGKPNLYYYTNINGERKWQKVGGGGIVDVETLPTNPEEENIYRLYEHSDVYIPTYTNHQYVTLTSTDIYFAVDSLTRAPKADPTQPAVTDGFYVNINDRMDDGKIYSGYVSDSVAMAIFNNHLIALPGYFNRPGEEGKYVTLQLYWGATKEAAQVYTGMGYMSAALADGEQYVTAVCPGEMDPCDGYPRYNDDFVDAYTLYTYKNNTWYGLGGYELTKEEYDGLSHARNAIYIVDIDE